MKTPDFKQQTAQNQHYVPKFILRNFLRDPEKEQVNVFRKSTGKGFTTSIKNIMAERRFHDFDIDENFYVTFEPSIGKIEDMLLPRYKKILDDQQLDGSPQEKADIGWLVAFQYIRTKSWRGMVENMQKTTEDHFIALGYDPHDVEGYRHMDENEIKIRQIEFLKNSGAIFAELVAEKDMMLFRASKGRSFYISDNPVCLSNNDLKPGPYGNIGFGLRGIEIYLPLSADLILAIWCPTILKTLRQQLQEAKDSHARAALLNLQLRRLNADGVRDAMLQFEAASANANALFKALDEGSVSQFTLENMDYVNSLQMHFAREFVICRDGNFALARRFMNDFPKHTGMKMT